MSSWLPFDVPDDLPLGAITWRPDGPPPGAKFVCEQPVTTMGTVVDGWRGGNYPVCRDPAKWRATATSSTKLHFVARDHAAIDFEEGEHRNVCGTHRNVLEAEGWDIEDLPE